MRYYKPNIKTIIGYIGVQLLFMYFILVIIDMIKINSWEELHIPMLLTVIICTYIIIVDRRVLTLGANVMFYMYTVFSLLGLMILLPWFPNVRYIRSDLTMSFLNYNELIYAISLSCIGIITFVVSSSIFSNKAKENGIITKVFGRGIKDLDQSICFKYRPITYLGIAICLYCALYFLYFALANRHMLMGSYVNRTELTNSSSIFSHTTVLMSLSIVMIFTTGSEKHLKIGMIIFSISAVINFLMGNRGEVYYPILACIAVYTQRRGTFKKVTLSLGIAGSLLLISIIRIVRDVGVLSNGVNDIIKTISPIESIAESFAEMGFQIGPFTYLLNYLNEGGNFQYGETIIYSFQVFLCKYLPFIPNPDYSSPAAIKTIMPTTYYAFSNLAEGYYNFGLIGLFGLAVFLAWYLVNSNKFVKGIYSLLFTNMFLVQIILWIRNSSSTMPVYLAWTIVLLILAWLTQLLYNSRKRF